MTTPPITAGEPEWDRGLWYMVLASGGLHVVALGLLWLAPHTFLHHPPPMLSYTVDLVAPDKVGGTNMIRGGKGRVDAPPMAAAAPKEEPKPPPPKAEPKPPEPPKPPPVEVAKPAPPPEPPKVEEKPKEDAVALAEKSKIVESPPTPTVEPAASPAKLEPPAPPTIDAQAAKAAAKAAKEAKEAAQAKAAKEAAEAKAAKEAAEAKAAKQAADAKAAKQAAEAKARDTQIAAAIRRVEQHTGVRGGGTGTKPGDQPGGAISAGSGEGGGGIVMGVEYLLYYNMLQSRIKQSWAWAGTNQTLEAVVRFNISDSGEVMNVRITHASGDASFDASVERAVRSLNPLPPPPEKYRQQFSDVEVPFSLAQLQQ